ncbi:stage II sporulation protein R [Halanaerocella petrolearia]
MSVSRRIKFVVGVSILISLLFLVGLRGSVVLKKNQVDAVTSSDDLLRLHVIANSNSLQDQKIKREVRDEIIKATAKLYTTEQNFDPTALIKRKLPYLKHIIIEKLRASNINYEVNLKVGRFNFPTRSYGGMTLPSGNYKALRVVLGSGQGENWWCVLFPPLCFVDSVDQVTNQDLKQVSSKEKKNNLPVEFKFKLVEVLKDNPQFVKSKLKLAHILETSFPGLDKLIFSNETNQQRE